MQWNELKSHLRHVSTKDQTRIQHAFELGKQVHADQKRKSGEPYFMHPIAVAHILADMGADADTLIAALLHDTVEDTDLTLEEIDKQFNGNVAALIDGVTKLTPEDVAEFPSLDDQIETLRKMFTLMEKDVRVVIIKLADRLHNMQTIMHLSESRQRSMAQETLDIYVKIADRLSMQELRNELEGLCLNVIDPRSFQELADLQTTNETRANTAIEDILQQISLSHPVTMAQVTAQYETKSWGKLRTQCNAGDQIITGVSALNAVFICQNIDTCYQVLGSLHQSWPRETLSFQDYISTPMINGYRGLHTTIILEDGTRVRCKIRTQDMQEYAVKGIASLCFDSAARGVLDYLLPWTQRIATLTKSTSDQSESFWESLQSDILGESILVHGPNDEQLMLPEGSTALDGVLYLYGTKGLRTKEITINGNKVNYYDVLPHACSISATFTSKSTASLEWLQYVQTGIAKAVIREALAKVPKPAKEGLGRELLDQAIENRAHIRLEEIDEETFASKVRFILGHKSLSALYVDIAEGKLDAESVVKFLFPADMKQQAKNGKQLWRLTLRYASEHADRVMPIFRSISPKKYKAEHKKSVTTTKADFVITTDQMEIIRTHLRTVLPDGKWSIRRVKSIWFERILLSSLILLWGLDPVFGEYLLKTQISAADLVIVRFLTFFVVSAGFFVLYKATIGRRLKPLAFKNPYLIGCGVSLFFTGTFSYFTLASVNAAIYILVIILGLMIGSILQAVRDQKNVSLPLIVNTILIFSVAFIAYETNAPLYGLGLAVLSSLAFAAYSHVNSRYLQDIETVQARYPEFLFWLSVICLPFTFIFLSSHNIHQLQPLHLTQLIGYVLLFAITPYAIYFEVLRRSNRQSLYYSTLPFVTLWAFLGDIFLHRSLVMAGVLPLLLIALFIMRKWRANNLH